MKSQSESEDMVTKLFGKDLDLVEFITRLSSNQMDNDLQIPQWILMLQENNLGSKQQLTNLIMTANEMKSRLIRIKLPTVIGQVDRLQKDYLELIEQAEKALKDGSETTETLSEQHMSDPLGRVLDYLSGINESRKGHFLFNLSIVSLSLSAQMRLCNYAVLLMHTVDFRVSIPLTSLTLTVGSRKGSQSSRRV